MEPRSTSHESVIKRATDVEKASQSRALNNTVGHAEMFALGGRRAGFWNGFERKCVVDVYDSTLSEPSGVPNKSKNITEFPTGSVASPPRKYLISLSYDAEQLLRPLSLMQVMIKNTSK